MIAGGEWRHREPTGGSVAGRFGQMPAHGGRVDNVAFSGDERVEPFDGEAKLAPLDDPHFQKIVEVAAVAWLVFYVSGVTADDVGVGAVFSNGEVGQDRLPGCSLSMSTTLKYRRSGLPPGLGTSSGLFPVAETRGCTRRPSGFGSGLPETRNSRPAV